MHKLTLFEKLNHLTRKSISPLSNFAVSSIVIDANGNEYNGVNIEYEIPTNSICAERNAIINALTNGAKMGEIAEVHILAMNKNNPEKVFTITPCGVCRQAILEASNCEAKVFMYNQNGEVTIKTIRELLPDAFEGVDK